MKNDRKKVLPQIASKSYDQKLKTCLGKACTYMEINIETELS